MWNPEVWRAYYILLIGTPEENLMAFILLPQIYSYRDLKIEVVFYMSARIHCFRPSEIYSSKHLEVESLKITYISPILSKGGNWGSCLVSLLGFIQKGRFTTHKALALMIVNSGADQTK